MFSGEMIIHEKTGDVCHITVTVTPFVEFLPGQKLSLTDLKSLTDTFRN